MCVCVCGVIRRLQWGTRTYIALMHTEIPCKHKIPLFIVHVNEFLHGKPVCDGRRLLHVAAANEQQQHNNNINRTRMNECMNVCMYVRISSE